MVVGNGMIARRFSEYATDDRFIVFASGVSNSGTLDQSAYEREEDLLRKVLTENSEKKLVYFSTCSIYDASLQSSLYVQHKLQIESLIEENCAKFCIFRVSNPVGFTSNPHTVLNFFIHRIESGKSFEVWKNASRNLIDIDDMYRICDAVLSELNQSRFTVNIANPGNYPVSFIIEEIERHLKKKGFYEVIEKGDIPKIDTSFIKPLLDKLSIDFDQNYLKRLLEKYYPV